MYNRGYDLNPRFISRLLAAELAEDMTLECIYGMCHWI